MPGSPNLCRTCPAFVPEDQARARMGKSIGAPVCGRFGYVLGRPGAGAAADMKIEEHRAATCGAYGQAVPSSVPSRPNQINGALIVALPSMEALNDTTPVVPESVTSCSQCKFFTRDDAVASEFGWPAGLCAKRGRLILPNEKVDVARNCDLRSFGTIRSSTADQQLLPEFEDHFGAVDPMKAWARAKASFVEPFEYPTDKPIEPDDLARGIRAWRRIPDQAGTGNEVYLPVYNMDLMPDHIRAKVPKTGDDEHPEDYVDHNNAVYRISVLWTELDETPALWGMAGVGKTEIYRHLAWLMCLPFERMSITASTELDDLAGKMLFLGNETKFRYGRLPNAWRTPSVICLDEPNAGPQEVWHFLRPLTDNSKQLVLDMNEGEQLDRHLDCYLGMAMNPDWDARNVGIAPIADADASRLMHIEMGLPPEAIEKAILKRRCELDGWTISEDQLKMVMKIANDIRPLTELGTLSVTWGVRPQIKVARALRWFDVLTAYRMALGDKMDPQQRQILLDQVRAHDGSNSHASP